MSWSEQAIENRKAFQRARQRARHQTAMHFKAEYHALWSTLDDGTAERGTVKARAMQAMVDAHPRTYQRYLAEQLKREPRVELQRGRKEQYPHGTMVAYKRHLYRKDPVCELCQEFWDTKFGTAKCRVCRKKFIPKLGTAMTCSEPCKWLWHSYFNYHLEWVRHRVYHSHTIIRHPERYPATQVRSAQRTIREFQRTGTVKKKRILSSNPTKAIAMAELAGIDLDKTMVRLKRETAAA